jgi:arylsulfatase A-like enzyme
MIYLNPAYTWMVPLLSIFICGTLGLALFFLGKRWAKLATVRNFIFVFAFTGFLSLLLALGWLSLYAEIILTLGVAIQTTRLLEPRAKRIFPLARVISSWLAVVVLGIVMAIYGGQAIQERRALAKLAPAPPDAPNVLLITLDTLRASNLSVYGYPRDTSPQLERLAQAGARFEMALSTTSWTLPSHASMFTGHYRHELSPGWIKPLDTTYPTVAEVLASRGYVTAGFVGNLSYCIRDTGINRGFIHYEDYPISVGEMTESTGLGRAISNNRTVRRVIGYYDMLGRKTAEQVNDAFLHWVGQEQRRPFFAFLNYFDVHEPYLPPAPFDTKFGSQSVRRNYLNEHAGHNSHRLEKEKMSPAEVQAEQDAYDGSIAYLDQQLGRLFDELEKRGLLENTLVIITSDHGEQFGEKGLFDHGNSLAIQTLHVPLIMTYRGHIPPGVVIRKPVSLRDIPATICDLINIKSDWQFPGNSLSQCWNSVGGEKDASVSPALSELLIGDAVFGQVWKGDKRSLVSDGKQYILHSDAKEELYDLHRDPATEQDLSGSETGRSAIPTFRSSLEQFFSRNDQRVSLPTKYWETEPLRSSRLGNR